jgi:hypothetical protein
MRLTIAALGLLIPCVPVFASDPATLDACVNNGNGIMRLVDATTLCHANETRVAWNIAGPAGPAGPQGPAGPAGTSAGGPPFTWICTPANYNSGSSTAATFFIFNGSASAANVALHILNKDGVNLAGVVIPGASPVNIGDPPPTYPGQTGAATVALPAGSTLIVKSFTAVGDPASGGNIPASVRVVSDQPVAVGSNIEFSGFHPVPCSLLPK